MKTVLITGASRGIGEGIARAFAKLNYTLILTYNKSFLECSKLAAELSKSSMVEIVKVDLNLTKDVENLYNIIKSKYKKVDILINNAGCAKIGLLTDLSLCEVDNLLNVNLRGTILVTKSILPLMPDGSRIINISSMWGIRGSSCESVYSAAKAGAIGFTKAMAKELKTITVNAIAPGLIETGINKDIPLEIKEEIILNTPVARIGTVEDVCNAVLFLAKDESSFITGQILSVDGGFSI